MIKVDQLTFGYEKNAVLSGVNCEMHDGCITAIIGPNGTGKSTLLKLCARLETPWHGTVSVDGKSVSDYESKAFAQTLAYLPQARPVPMIPVRTLVMHGRFARLGPSRRPSPQDEAAVDCALEMAKLTSLAHRDVSTLSGGQRQKAYLAMAIAQDAKHILLDEPLTHLDIGCQLELMEILRKLRDKNRCIVMVVHDLALLPQVCSHALLLHEGNITYSGDVQNLFDSGMIEHVFGVKLLHNRGISFEKSI